MNYHMLFEVLFSFESVATFSALVRSLSSVGPHVSYQTHFLMEWFFTECASIPKRPASMDSLASSPLAFCFTFFPTIWAHKRPLLIFGQQHLACFRIHNWLPWQQDLTSSPYSFLTRLRYFWQCRTRVVCRKPEKSSKFCCFPSRCIVNSWKIVLWVKEKNMLGCYMPRDRW